MSHHAIGPPSRGPLRFRGDFMTKYTLSKPIEFGGKTYAELNFREATIGDMMVTDAFKGELSKTIALLAAVADTPIQVFKLIPLKELKKMESIVDNPLGEQTDTSDTT